MPCDASHMEASQWEIEASRVVMLLEELETGVPVNTRSRSWNGYRDDVYNRGANRAMLDKLTAALCEQLGKIGDVSRYSLELQLWWKNHRRADIAKKIQEYKSAIYGLQKSTRRNMDDTSPVGQAAALLWQKIDALRIEDEAILGRPVGKDEEDR